LTVGGPAQWWAAADQKAGRTPVQAVIAGNQAEVYTGTAGATARVQLPGKLDLTVIASPGLGLTVGDIVRLTEGISVTPAAVAYPFQG
jgi:hypothetical protein